MRVEIKFAKANYAVDVTDDSYNAIKLGTVEDKNSKNFGNPKETILGYCVSMPSALNKIIKNGLASQDEVITLQEYTLRIERALDELKSFVGVEL